MSKTVLSALDGFTPLIDSVVDEMGLAAAAVFGKVWRYCQMETGACTASQDRLASELHISDRTLRTHLDALVERGYLALVRTAGGTNEYRDTGKAGLSIRIAATPEKISDLPRKKFPGGAEKISDPPRKNFPTKIDSLRDSSRELEYESEPAEKFSTMRKTIETLTGRLSTPGDVSTIEKFVAEGVIEEDIRSALAWRVSQGLRPVANIRQLESGVLRNKADRVQAAAAATVKPGVTAGQPAKKETALDRTKAALQKVMAEALREEELHNVN